MPRMVTCFECKKEHPGRKITFNLAMVDPFFYALYQKEPQRLLDAFTICEQCDKDQTILENKEW